MGAEFGLNTCIRCGLEERRVVIRDLGSPFRILVHVRRHSLRPHEEESAHCCTALLCAIYGDGTASTSISKQS